MPELNALKIEGFQSEDTGNIPYKDKMKEKQRLAKLDKIKQQIAAKKDLPKENKSLKEKPKIKKPEESDEDGDSDDIEEMRREAALLKKLKRGKITQAYVIQWVPPLKNEGNSTDK